MRSVGLSPELKTRCAQQVLYFKVRHVQHHAFGIRAVGIKVQSHSLGPVAEVDATRCL